MALRLFVSEYLVVAVVSATIRFRPYCHREHQLPVTTAHTSPAARRLYKGAGTWSLLNEVTGRSRIHIHWRFCAAGDSWCRLLLGSRVGGRRATHRAGRGHGRRAHFSVSVFVVGGAGECDAPSSSAEGQLVAFPAFRYLHPFQLDGHQAYVEA